MPGQTTAFIGPTGSGKSTLINLIPRFFDVTDGNILIDGINIKDISQKDLHDIIGYVPQKGILFSGDVESNLRLGKENALNRDLNLAIEISQATEFINSNDEKLKLKISQNGNNVSGGQRQRLSIARAILSLTALCVATTNTLTPFSISASVPCLSSPAASASQGIPDVSLSFNAPSLAVT